MTATPVRSVDSRSPASGRRPVEMLRMPDAAWWAWWVGRALVRHPRRAVAVMLAVDVGARTGSALAGAGAAVGVYGVAAGVWAVRSRRAGGTTRPADLILGAAHAHALRRAWPDMCAAARVSAPRGHGLPRLRRWAVTPGGGITAITRLGAAVDTLAACPTLADAAGCREIVITRPHRDRHPWWMPARMAPAWWPDRSGHMPGWARVEAVWGDRLNRTITLADLEALSQPAGRIVYGTTVDKRPASIDPGKSVLIGGVTRSGKSTAVWCLLAGLRRAGIPTRLYVSDAKGGIELRQLGQHLGRDTGTIRVAAYATTPAAADKLIDAVASAMDARLADMGSRGARKHAPTPDEPLCVLIIDELLPLQAQLAKGTASNLGRLLYMGAAAGYVTWAGTQDATVEALGRARDLIPQRIAFAVRNRAMAEVILGTDAVADGARAWKIRTAGVGYSETDGEWGFRRFRTAYVSDVEAIAIAAGTLAGQPAANTRTALYRWYGHGPADEPADTREDERLLYVGISHDAVHRYDQHRAAGKDWTSRAARCTVQWHPTRAQAEAAEQAAIRAEAPEANIAHAIPRQRRVPA